MKRLGCRRSRPSIRLTGARGLGRRLRHHPRAPVQPRKTRRSGRRCSHFDRSRSRPEQSRRAPRREAATTPGRRNACSPSMRAAWQRRLGHGCIEGCGPAGSQRRPDRGARVEEVGPCTGFSSPVSTRRWMASRGTPAARAISSVVKTSSSRPWTQSRVRQIPCLQSVSDSGLNHECSSGSSDMGMSLQQVIGSCRQLVRRLSVLRRNDSRRGRQAIRTARKPAASRARMSSPSGQDRYGTERSAVSPDAAPFSMTMTRPPDRRTRRHSPRTWEPFGRVTGESAVAVVHDDQVESNQRSKGRASNGMHPMSTRAPVCSTARRAARGRASSRRPWQDSPESPGLAARRLRDSRCVHADLEQPFAHAHAAHRDRQRLASEPWTDAETCAFPHDIVADCDFTS